MEGIQVSVEKTGVNNNIAVIKVGGYIDTTTSAELEHALDDLLRNGVYDIVIDLGNVDYISSAGWGIFISEIKGIREKGGDLKLVRMIPDVYEVFELLEFHYILKAFDSLEDAIADFGGKAGSGSARQPARHATAGGNDRESLGSRGATDSVVVDQPAASTNKSIKGVDDSIREIVVNDPAAGALKIKQLLGTPKYGNYRVGWFEVRRKLKGLGLDSKQKRVQYLRQKSA